MTAQTVTGLETFCIEGEQYSGSEFPLTPEEIEARDGEIIVAQLVVASTGLVHHLRVPSAPQPRSMEDFFASAEARRRGDPSPTRPAPALIGFGRFLIDNPGHFRLQQTSGTPRIIPYGVMPGVTQPKTTRYRVYEVV